MVGQTDCRSPSEGEGDFYLLSCMFACMYTIQRHQRLAVVSTHTRTLIACTPHNAKQIADERRGHMETSRSVASSRADACNDACVLRVSAGLVIPAGSIYHTCSRVPGVDRMDCVSPSWRRAIRTRTNQENKTKTQTVQAQRRCRRRARHNRFRGVRGCRVCVCASESANVHRRRVACA